MTILSIVVGLLAAGFLLVLVGGAAFMQQTNERLEMLDARTAYLDRRLEHTTRNVENCEERLDTLTRHADEVEDRLDGHDASRRCFREDLEALQAKRWWQR